MTPIRRKVVDGQHGGWLPAGRDRLYEIDAPMRDRAESIPSEIEAKLLVPRASDVRAIARVEQLDSHSLRPRDTLRLRSIYVDTPEFTLARGTVALRLRDTGSGWEATAKCAGHV